MRSRAGSLTWPLTGRDDELAAVLAAADRPGAHVVVAGRAGVGKSRLVREAVTAMSAAGRPVVRVAATDAASAIPLGAFAPVLRGVSGEPGTLGTLIAAGDAVLAHGGGAGLVVAVDDAHLLDDGSAALVGHLAARGEVSLVVTVRTGAPCSDIVVNLWKDLDSPRLEVQALSADEVAVLLTRALSGRPAAAAVAWAHRTSEGNPLYLRELVEGAVAAGDLVERDGMWQLVRAPRPTGRLQDLVAARLAGLQAGDAEVVELVALGEPLPLATLEHAVPLEAVTRLERLEVLRIDPADGEDGELTVRLGHPLYGEVVRAQVGRVAARGLRRTLAAALTAVPSTREDDTLRIVTWRLDSGDAVDAVALRTAATEAAAALDHGLAVRLAEAAHAQGRDLASAVIAAASHRALGRSDRAADLLAAAEDVAATAARAGGPDAGAARAAVFSHVASLHWGLGRLDDALALLDRATGWSARPDWVDWVDGQRVTQLATGGRLPDAVTAARAVLERPELAAPTRVAASVGAAYALHQTGRTAESLATLDDAAALVAADPTARSDWPPDALWPLVAAESGRAPGEAVRRATSLRDRALGARDAGTAGWMETLLGRAALLAGDVDTALDRLSEAEAHLVRRDSRGLLPSCRALQVAATASGGRDDELVAAHRAGRPHRRPAAWLVLADTVRADVWAEVAAGDAATGARVAVAAAATHTHAPLLAAEFLHLAVRVGAPARAVLGDLRAASRRTDSPLAHARLAHVDALAAGDAAGLAAAAEALAAAGSPLEAAEAGTAAVGRHRADGRAGAAATTAAAVETWLARCPGADTPALRTVAVDAGLTAREREVATLAAHGCSNVEIADRLTVSVRTVESHVYRATTKLGVTRREDLRPLLRGRAPVQ